MPHNLGSRFVNAPLLRIFFGFRVSIWDSDRHPLHHLLHPMRAGMVRGGARDAAIDKGFRMEAAVLLCVLGQDRFLIADGIALTVQTIILGRFTLKIPVPGWHRTLREHRVCPKRPEGVVQCSGENKKSLEIWPESEVNFGCLSEQFPELVDEKGNGWLYRHVKNLV